MHMRCDRLGTRRYCEQSTNRRRSNCDGQQMITDAGQAGPMSVLRDQLRDLSHKAATAAGMCNANQVLVDRGWVVSHVC
jgi:aerobic-type carbon monoxide dehydrogenase small subunit (CoxS/CutS family)